MFLHRSFNVRRGGFCLCDSLAIVGRTRADQGNQRNNGEPASAFGKHRPGAEGLRLHIPQKAATLL
jgi:hypothetical protein